MDRVSGKKLKVGPGPTHGFGGATQKGWSPEMWGLSIEQVMFLKQHPCYNREGKDGKPYLMNDLVKDIKRITDGTGMGWSLLINQEEPLKAKVMVSVRHFHLEQVEYQCIMYFMFVICLASVHCVSFFSQSLSIRVVVIIA